MFEGKFAVPNRISSGAAAALVQAAATRQNAKASNLPEDVILIASLYGVEDSYDCASISFAGNRLRFGMPPQQPPAQQCEAANEACSKK
jgi:hypothetical protein